MRRRTCTTAMRVTKSAHATRDRSYQQKRYEIPEKFNQVQGLLDPLRVHWSRGLAARPHSDQQRGEV